MQIRLRVAPFGKIPEIYRGKRGTFADVEGGVAHINSKGEFVAEDANLTLPYQTSMTISAEQKSDNVYQDMMRRATQQMTRLLRKKQRVLIKRGHVSTTRDVQKKHKLVSLPPPQRQTAVDREDEIVDEAHVDDVNMESILTSMFSQVNDLDISDLLQHLEQTHSTTSVPQLHETEDEDAEEESEHKIEENDNEEEDDDNEDQDEHAEEEEEEEEDGVLDDVEDEDGDATALLTTTLYRDGKMVESLGPLEDSNSNDCDFDSPKPRKKGTRKDKDEDDDSRFSSSDDDGDDDDPIRDDIDGDLSLFDNNNDPLLSDHEDFDMYKYDGLADVYED